MSFPATRLRRLRGNENWRSLVSETHVAREQLIYPMFVLHGSDRREPVGSMPGIERMSINHLLIEAAELVELGLLGLLLFGVPSEKDQAGSGAYDPEGVVQMAVRALKDAHPDLLVMTDVCLCGYTAHGHCGWVDEQGKVDNDLSVELLAKTALSHAEAGADAVAPSDMMDGRVGAIRSQLDHEGYNQTAIVAYSAKYASTFYGPFREAAESAPGSGDRRSYQLDPANVRQALRGAVDDVDEGADVVMVKPALAYLDVVRALRDRLDVPLAAYNVSGEYSMLKAAVAAGYLDERQAVLETLTSIKRAGADMIFTYHAKEAASWL